MQGGFQTQDDLKMIQELRQKHSYWENKLKELTNGDKVDVAVKTLNQWRRDKYESGSW